MPRKESTSRVEGAGLLLAMTTEPPTNYGDTHDLFGIAPDTAVPCANISLNDTTNNKQHDDDKESIDLDERQLVKEFDKLMQRMAMKRMKLRTKRMTKWRFAIPNATGQYAS